MAKAVVSSGKGCGSPGEVPPCLKGQVAAIDDSPSGSKKDAAAQDGSSSR